MGNRMINLDNSSDGESKDDSLFSGSPNQLLLLGEETVSLDDNNVTNESNAIPNSSIVIPTDIPVPFEEYYTNSDNVRLIDRSRYLLAACFGTVEEYSLEVSPYKDLKNQCYQHRLCYDKRYFGAALALKLEK